MSLETDARDALRAAMVDIYDVDVPPEHFDDTKPSDPGIGAKNGPAWLETLETAAANLDEKGYSVAKPTLVKASELREQDLIESSIYLEDLSSAFAAPTLAKVAAVTVLTVIAGAAVWMWRLRPKADK